jgi:hypothetical protein
MTATIFVEAYARTLLTDLQRAIDDRERDRFTSAYTQALDGCYACHQAAEKPYLRPHIAAQSEVQIIRFDPTLPGVNRGKA